MLLTDKSLMNYVKLSSVVSTLYYSISLSLSILLLFELIFFLVIWHQFSMFFALFELNFQVFVWPKKNSNLSHSIEWMRNTCAWFRCCCCCYCRYYFIQFMQRSDDKIERKNVRDLVEHKSTFCFVWLVSLHVSMHRVCIAVEE